MIIRIVVRVFDNKNLLNQPQFSEVTVVILVWVHILILDRHVKFIYLESVSICDLDPEMADCLEVVHLNLLLNVVWAENNIDR